MRVCFVVSQIFAWGKYGGFGILTRMLGRELVKQGIEVCAVLPQRSGQQKVTKLDGITVLGYPAFSILSTGNLYKECNAHVYHSEEPSFGTYIAERAMPNSKHIVTSQDPRNIRDWIVHFRYLSPSKKISFPLSYTFEQSYFTNVAVRKADRVFCQAKFIREKVKRKYNLPYLPNFLPNPVVIPKRKIEKANCPTVCFLGRWDPVKRPEIFFELAKAYPSVSFIAVGKDHDVRRDAYLRSKYSHLPNLEMPGFIDQLTSDKLFQILEKSWIFINTSVKECLPVSFLEAVAHKCAIISGVTPDPDGFTGQFGFHVTKDNFSECLEYLLEHDRWREKGERGYEYVKETHEIGKVVNQHITIYREICKLKS